MLKTENNIYNLPYNDLKEYLCFIEHIFDEIEFDMQIYKDFNNARITQQIKPNYFIYWCIRNYYKSLVLNLCKLLEPRKDDKNKFTLTHFIDLLKYNTIFIFLILDYYCYFFCYYKTFWKIIAIYEFIMNNTPVIFTQKCHIFFICPLRISFKST